MFKAYEPKKNDDKLLLRCQCGALFWKGSEELEKHQGHGQIKAASEGTWWELIKIRLGWIK